MDLSRLGLAVAALPSGVPARRCPVDSIGLLTACRVTWEQGGQLVALWGCDDRDRDRGYAINVVLQDGDGLTLLEHSLPTGESTYPDLAVVFPAANRMQRAAFDLVGIAVRGRGPAAMAVAGELADRPLPAAPRFRGFAEMAARRGGLPVRARRRRRRARDPGRAGARRHHRARALPLPDRRREGAAARGAARLRPQGHREALRGDAGRRRATASPAAFPATARSRTRGRMRRRSRRSPERAPPPRALWLRALALERERIANHLGDLGYLGNDGGFAFGLAQFSRLKEDVLRDQPRRVRPSARDGFRRARRRRARHRARGRRGDARRMRDARARNSRSLRTSTTSTPACRIGSARAAS